MCGSCESYSKYWNWCQILKLLSNFESLFSFSSSAKTNQMEKSTNHSLWALKHYHFWVKALNSLKGPQNSKFGRSFFQLKTKRNTGFKFDGNFNTWNMIRSLHKMNQEVCLQNWNWMILSSFRNIVQKYQEIQGVPH